MTLVPGYSSKTLRITRQREQPGLVFLTIFGPRGGDLAKITLTEASAHALGSYLFDPEGGMKA